MNKIIVIIIIFIFTFSSSGFDFVTLSDDYNYISVEKNISSPYYEKVQQIGGNGDENGKFYIPRGIVFDGVNRLYVCDSENDRISVFEDNIFLFNIENNLDSPLDIIKIPGTQRYVVTDKETKSFKIFFRDGRLMSEYGGKPGFKGFNFGYISGLYIDKEYNIYITDRLNDNIKVVDRYMNIINVFSEKGKEKGKLNEPFDILVDNNGRIYVTNYGNDRIDVYDSRFNFLFYIGERGSRPTQFRGPSGISADSYGNIYVCDKHNGRIQKFNEDGLFMGMIGDGILKNPVFSDVDQNGKIYVTDEMNNNVTVFSPNMFILGRDAVIAKEYEKGAELLEKALKIDNKNINAYYYLGYCYYKLEKYNMLKDLYKKLETIDKNSRAYELITVIVNEVDKWISRSF